MPSIYQFCIIICISVGIIGGVILFGPEQTAEASFQQQQVITQFAASIADPQIAKKLGVNAPQNPLDRSPANEMDHENINFQIPQNIDSEFVQNQGATIIQSCEVIASLNCDRFLMEIASRDELNRYESENFVKAYLRRESVPIQERLNFYQNWRAQKQIPSDDVDANDREDFLKMGGKRNFPIDITDE